MRSRAAKELPELGGISFVEYRSQKESDEALLTSLERDLAAGRLPENSGYYARVIRRYINGYPVRKSARPKSRLGYWVSALYWLLRDDGDKYAANKVAAWCRTQGITRRAQSVERTARTAEGLAARERIRNSLSSERTRCEESSVFLAHVTSIQSRILHWHHGSADFTFVQDQRQAARWAKRKSG